MENNFFTLLKEKLHKRFDKLTAEVIEETRKDFDEIWDRYFKELEIKKSNMVRDGQVIQNVNETMVKRGNELREDIKNLEELFEKLKKDNDAIRKKLEENESEVKRIKDEKIRLAEKDKVLKTKENLLKVKEESLDSKEAWINVQLQSVEDKQNSLKKIYNEINKYGR